MKNLSLLAVATVIFLSCNDNKAKERRRLKMQNVELEIKIDSTDLANSLNNGRIREYETKEEAATKDSFFLVTMKRRADHWKWMREEAAK